ncbi:MAG: hypothetical protein HC860_23140 [Alkalinema sp. RU_4_3]|nr:hypothetical protein [Alkalinema sp. RU_4_3]
MKSLIVVSLTAVISLYCNKAISQPIAASTEARSAVQTVESFDRSKPNAKPSTAGSRQDRSWEEQGKATTGETISLSLDSIQIAQRSLGVAKPPGYFFQYRIGPDMIYGMTLCNGEFSTSRTGDRYGQPITPKSEANQRMLDRVCNYRVTKAQAIASSPVQMGPEGKTICTIKSDRDITLYGQDGEWFYTDACRKIGMIHSSQIRM